MKGILTARTLFFQVIAIATVFSGQAQAQDSLTNGLVAYYPFNGNANDESGYGHNGIVNGASLTADRAGVLGHAYYFNSTNSSLIQIQDFDLPTGSQSRTFALWIRAEAIYPATVFQTSSLFGYGTHSDGLQAYLNYEPLPNVLTINLNKFGPDLSGRWGAWVSNWDFDMWHHVVYVLEGTNFLTVYLNGNALTVSSPNPNPGFDVRSTTLTVGGFESNFFDGALDELRIYHRALSQPEVLQLYNAEKPPLPVIEEPPQSRALAVGGTAMFDVIASGPPPVKYQWHKDGTPLPAATNSTLRITNVQPPQIGAYVVVVSNPYGSVTSSVASLNLTNVSSSLWQGLVAYYPFNGNANDESGFGDHGVVYGAQLSADRFGNANRAYDFVATNLNTISATGASLPRSNAPRTLSLWFKPRPLKSAPFSVEYAVAWGSLATRGGMFSAALNSHNGIGVVGNFADSWTYTFGPLNDYWHHFVIGFDGGTNAWGFLDGFR